MKVSLWDGRTQLDAWMIGVPRKGDQVLIETDLYEVTKVIWTPDEAIGAVVHIVPAYGVGAD